jgi:phosphoribosylformylglycinamidine (FGAM) synthase-like enzyme
MWELSEAIDGMAEACTAFGVPVVGGNVSLYNETRGHDIDPTPVIGMLGMVDRLERRPPGAGLVEGGTLLLVGNDTDPVRGLVGSRWAWEHEARGGEPAALDVVSHRALADVVRSLVLDGWVTGLHDVGEGGLALTLAELAVASHVGFTVRGVADGTALFSESPSRIVMCVEADRVAAVGQRCDAGGVPWTELGRVGGDRLVVEGLLDVGLDEAVAVWRDRLPGAFGVASTH